MYKNNAEQHEELLQMQVDNCIIHLMAIHFLQQTSFIHFQLIHFSNYTLKFKMNDL